METAVMHSIFVACMRAYLRGEKAAPLDLTPQEWGKLYHLAKKQNVSGALFSVTEGQAIPDAVHDRLRRDAFLTMAAYETQNAMIADIQAAFAAKEIAHLFFKGAVVRRYYHNPAMRSMGDIDVLVRPDDQARARAVMEELGFTCSADQGAVWVLERQGYYVELHSETEMYHVKRHSRVVYEEAWLSARLKSGATYQWSHETEAVFSLSHLIKHFCSEGCGIRQLMDIAVLYERDPDDALWERVMTRMRALGGERFSRHLLYMCRKWFGTPVSEKLAKPLTAELYEGMCEHLLGDGVFGDADRLMSANERIDRQHQKKGGKAGHMVRWLFPPAAQVSARYRYAQKSPLLVPVAYVHRAWDGVTANRRIHAARMAYARDHRDTLDAEVRFFNEIGL